MDNPDLLSLLYLPVPETKTRENCFLDVVGQPYRELAISNSYAFFFDRNKNKYISDLFINSLIELIKEKLPEKNLEEADYTCLAETSTKKGGRIDLLLDAPNAKQCVIIENKIFHVLNNNLDDYWTIKDYPFENKVGVVLSIHELPIDEKLQGKFINITHDQYIKKIQSQGIPNKISPKEFIYITDFLNHMSNIAKSKEMNEQARFYFEHTAPVLKAIETENQAYEFIIHQLQLAAAKMNWELYGSSEDWRHIWDAKNKVENIYYAIEIHELFSVKPRINIIIELHKDAVSKETYLRDKYKKELINLGNEGRGGSGWLHFVHKWYDLNLSEIEGLSDFIVNKINSEFKWIMDKLITEIYPGKI